MRTRRPRSIFISLYSKLPIITAPLSVQGRRVRLLLDTALPVVTQDLRFVKQGLGVPIDAMIGLDVLGWSNLGIDYEAKNLIFGVQVSEEPKVPLELGPGCMLLSVRTNGRRLRLMVDTGASSLMFFEHRFRAPFPRLRPKGQKEFTNMGGGVRMSEVELPGLEIGTIEFGPRLAVLIPSTADSTPEFDGLLGLRSLESAECISISTDN